MRLYKRYVGEIINAHLFYAVILTLFLCFAISMSFHVFIEVFFADA